VTDSRLEIAFEGKTKGFDAPSYKVFTNETQSGTVIFDVETRIIGRHIGTFPLRRKIRTKPALLHLSEAIGTSGCPSAFLVRKVRFPK
jgi:hypothetical protein